MRRCTSVQGGQERGGGWRPQAGDGLTRLLRGITPGAHHLPLDVQQLRRADRGAAVALLPRDRRRERSQPFRWWCRRRYFGRDRGSSYAAARGEPAARVPAVSRLAHELHALDGNGLRDHSLLGQQSSGQTARALPLPGNLNLCSPGSSYYRFTSEERPCCCCCCCSGDKI